MVHECQRGWKSRCPAMVHECHKGGRDGIQSWPINFKGGEYTNAQPWSMNVQEGEQAGVKPWSIKCKRVVEPVSSYYPPLGSTCQKEPLHFVCFIQHFAWKLVPVLNWPYQGHGGFGEGLQRLKKKKKIVSKSKTRKFMDCSLPGLRCGNIYRGSWCHLRTRLWSSFPIFSSPT